jgi:hypothetical protein
MKGRYWMLILPRMITLGRNSLIRQKLSEKKA